MIYQLLSNLYITQCSINILVFHILVETGSPRGWQLGAGVLR